MLKTARYYKLNKSLDGFADYSVFKRNGCEPKNKIENLRSIIINYKRRINEASKNQIKDLQELLLKKENENYTHNIVLPNNDYYNLTWSISKAKKIIMDNKITPKTYSVSELYNYIAPGAVEKNNLDISYRNENPIIIVELQKYLLMDKPKPYVIIDGNHRLSVKNENNAKEIKGYLLHENIQIEALSSELDRILYKVHHNKHVMIDFLFDSITKEEMNESLFEI